jgi:hypothetical protein
MATQYGYQTLLWLENFGWEAVPIPDEEWGYFGDQRVTDPINKEVISVYEGVKRQAERTGNFPYFLPMEYIDDNRRSS